MDEHVEFLVRLFASKPKFHNGLSELIAYCRSIQSTAPWKLLERVDIEADSDSFARWLRRKSPRPEGTDTIRAFYFGLSEDGVALHLDGAADFDAADDTYEWACSYVYRSPEDWSGSEVLGAFAHISEVSDGSVPILLYLLCLGYSGLLIQRHVPEVLWGIAEPAKPVAVGFDDGDTYMVLLPTKASSGNP